MEETEIDLKQGLQRSQSLRWLTFLLGRWLAEANCQIYNDAAGTVPDSVGVIILVRLLSPDRASSAMRHRLPRRSL